MKKGRKILSNNYFVKNLATTSKIFFASHNTEIPYKVKILFPVTTPKKSWYNFFFFYRIRCCSDSALVMLERSAVLGNLEKYTFIHSCQYASKREFNSAVKSVAKEYKNDVLDYIDQYNRAEIDKKSSEAYLDNLCNRIDKENEQSKVIIKGVKSSDIL